MIRVMKKRCTSCKKGWWQDAKLIGCRVGGDSKFSRTAVTEREDLCPDYDPVAGAPAERKVATRKRFDAATEHTQELIYVAKASTKTRTPSAGASNDDGEMPEYLHLYSTGSAIAATTEGQRTHAYIPPGRYPLAEGWWRVDKQAKSSIQLTAVDDRREFSKFSGLLQPRAGAQYFQEQGQDNCLAELHQTIGTGAVKIEAFLDATSNQRIDKFEILEKVGKIMLTGGNLAAIIPIVESNRNKEPKP